ncbi:UTP--glucose-1-phosphate uridylyltransferase [Desulfosporosinus sp. I2]|nr:UTP--glucose-1-phosphate uridylyltransferase [Desulfosporosinus sp. I2]
MNLTKYIKIIAYDFEGHRYDVGDKLGFIQATIEYGLRHDDLSDDLMNYLRELIQVSSLLK